ncbi:tetratricopeptide repeat-containing sulfotransferase family protein [Thalassovita sp.]|uniref:tetratricopeptide repeat-containing sulfotransferase family protein n=1 Tax=Thalassovita sp. TaxID=1979401 RepID=UPI002B2785F4|nr:sulfotransferase [Thalassovita sp.]
MTMAAKQLADKAKAHLDSGRAKSAFKTAKTAMKKFPKESFFPNVCGIALTQQNNQREAISYFRKALQLFPGNIDAQNNLVQALTSVGQSDAALTLIEKYLTSRKDRDNLLYFKAVAESHSGDHPAAESTLNNLLADYPRLARAHNLLGAVLFSLGREDEALAAYQKALDIDPNSPDTLTNMALIQARANEMEKALDYVEKALALNPNHYLSLQRYGNLLNESGQTEKAIETFHKLLEIEPHSHDALLELATLSPAAEQPALQPKIDAALRKVPKNTLQHAFICLAKAKSALKIGDRAETDKWFAIGNEAFAAQVPFDRERTRAEFEAICGHFPAGQPVHVVNEPFSPTPIFVLGLPRSGTTLTEQVISSHPSVYGAGELPGIERGSRIFLEKGVPWDLTTAQELAQFYQSFLPEMPEETTAFVDKMPGNYKRIGFILSALPNARIVHLIRDPREVALSMWHTVFSNPGQAYTFNQKVMAQELNDYRRYMNHWASVFPDRILDLRYSDLVSDIEQASKILADHCGLDWVSDMAHPERNAGAVRTASANQVRQPVHRDSLAKWKQHEQALAELIANLDPTLWPELGEG